MNKRYAKIENESVVNIIVAASTYAQGKAYLIELPDESPVEIGWTYFNGAFVAPPGELLADRIQDKLKLFDKATTDYIYAHYAAPSQQSLVAELVEAMFTGKQNKLALIMSIKSWIATVLDYHWATWAQIEACQSKEELDLIVFDLEQFDSTDPQVSLQTVAEAQD